MPRISSSLSAEAVPYARLPATHSKTTDEACGLSAL
jgi:hypothetical protein